MALIKCPECGKEISDKAPACPNCGMPLRREDRGTYDIVITREKQFYIVNPKIKITVDSSDEYAIANGERLVLKLTTGNHTILFASGVRKTQTVIEVTENMNIGIKFNRTTGEIDVNGYRTNSQTNTPPVSVGISGGFFKGMN